MSDGRTVAVIGSGQTGVSAATGFQNAGFHTSLFSERPRASLRNDIPATGTAVTFAQAQAAERALGLDDYRARAPLFTGTSVRAVDSSGDPLLEFDSEFDSFQAVGVDTRLKTDERLSQFINAGGTFVVDSVNVESLNDIAREHDLTVVATGRAGLASLFPINVGRTPYRNPQRHLLMLTVGGLEHGPEVFAHRSPAGGQHGAFSVYYGQGEAWWGPYLHKDAGPVWSFLGFAQPDSDWQRRFAQATSGESARQIVVDLHKDYLPWDYRDIDDIHVIEQDPHSWLQGAVSPAVRHPVAHTPGGQPIIALGDAAISFDPIGAQGAQAGLIQAAQLVQAAKDHAGTYDTAWLHTTFEHFWSTRAAAASRVTRLFLADEQWQPYSQRFFVAAAENPRFASALFGLISEPAPLLAVDSVDTAEDLIARAVNIAHEDTATTRH